MTRGNGARKFAATCLFAKEYAERLQRALCGRDLATLVLAKSSSDSLLISEVVRRYGEHCLPTYMGRPGTQGHARAFKHRLKTVQCTFVLVVSKGPFNT